MKKRIWIMLSAFVLGAALSLAGEGSNLLVMLLKPWTALGNGLRGLSLSGGKGNAAAWAIVGCLSLLPIAYILIARRRKKLPGDWLFVLSGAGVFGGLFLLANPTLMVHEMMTAALAASPEVLTGGPVYAMTSLLLVSAAVRWSGGLNDGKLIFWMRALLTAAMAVIALGMGSAAIDAARMVWPANAAQDPWMAGLMVQLTPDIAGAESSGAVMMLLSLIMLIPDGFLLWMMDAGVTLTGAMKDGWFTEGTGEAAGELAKRAKYSLIAAVSCMAVKNILTLLLGQWILQSEMNLALPLDDMLISCSAMLLARLLRAACRVKRDNDLMI